MLFYIPVLFGVKFLPILLVSFIITDFFIGLNRLAMEDYPEIKRHFKLMSERASFSA